MAWDGTERRGSPRVMLEEALICELVIRARVRLLDVSASGTLVASDTPLPVGGRGELTTVLPSGGFASAVEIRRAHGAAQGRVGEFGTMFTAMDATSQRHLAAFIRTASE
jgi:hypothetical protein